MTGPSSVSMNPSSTSCAERVGGDDKDESVVQVLVAQRVVERMEDVFVGDAVLAGAVDDQRLHDTNLRCRPIVGNLCCRWWLRLLPEARRLASGPADQGGAP